MAKLEWLPEAQDDLQRVYEFIRPHSPSAAKKAIKTLIGASEALINFPESGKPWKAKPDTRELWVGFGAKGYVIRYRIWNDNVIILRVWHALEDR